MIDKSHVEVQNDKKLIIKQYENKEKAKRLRAIQYQKVDSKDDRDGVTIRTERTMCK